MRPSTHKDIALRRWPAAVHEIGDAVEAVLYLRTVVRGILSRLRKIDVVYELIVLRFGCCRFQPVRGRWQIFSVRPEACELPRLRALKRKMPRFPSACFDTSTGPQDSVPKRQRFFQQRRRAVIAVVFHFLFSLLCALGLWSARAVAVLLASGARDLC